MTDSSVCLISVSIELYFWNSSYSLVLQFNILQQILPTKMLLAIYETNFLLMCRLLIFYSTGCFPQRIDTFSYSQCVYYKLREVKYFAVSHVIFIEQDILQSRLLMGGTTYSVVQNVSFSSEFDTVRVLVMCGTHRTLYTRAACSVQNTVYTTSCTNYFVQSSLNIQSPLPQSTRFYISRVALYFRCIIPSFSKYFRLKRCFLSFRVANISFGLERTRWLAKIFDAKYYSKYFKISLTPQ